MPLPKISLKINEETAQAINIDCRGLKNQIPTQKSQHKKNQNQTL
jgi:hypothetical protein